MSEQAAIVITYAAIPNGRAGQGFLPVITVNGHQKGNTWASAGVSRDDALEAARARAVYEAERYSGFNITIAEASAT